MVMRNSSVFLAGCYCHFRSLAFRIFVVVIFPSLLWAQEVQNLNDTGTGSLRAVVVGAAPNATITFHSSLNGATITLLSEIHLDKDLILDASSLSQGIRISGNSDGNGELNPNEGRIFTVNDNVEVRLRALTLMDGQVDPKPGPPVADAGGGAILNFGVLYLEQCLIVNCAARDGGAIYNGEEARLSLMQTTITGNLAAENGGAIYNTGTAVVALEESTLSGNSAGSAGGGLWTEGGDVEVIRTIMADNEAGTGADVQGPLHSQLFSFGIKGQPAIFRIKIKGQPAIFSFFLICLSSTA